MVSLKIEVRKKDVSWVVLLVAVLVIGVVYAYGTSSPSVMGHSAGEIAGMDNYYTKGEVYTKDEINTMISAIEVGGTGCPVGYTLYEQSTETAKCYKDGEVITSTAVSSGVIAICKGRIINGILQSHATCDELAWMGYSDAIVNSGWVNGASSVKCRYATPCSVYCSTGWNGISGELKEHPNWPKPPELPSVSFGNILQVK